MDRILIGIPTLNGPHRLKACIDSLYSTHDLYFSNGLLKPNITILVVDDGSFTENLHKNIEICETRNINLLMQNDRLGVATAWNTLINHKDADYCILLNDDVIVSHNWIDAVVHTLKHNNNIGVVGLNAYEGPNSTLPPNNVPTYVESKILLGSKFFPVLSARGFAFGFRKQDYVSINGFDQQFFCFFEEIDFNINMMKLLGKRNCMLSHPILKHTHGATTFETLPNHNDIFLESKAKFEAKWRMEWKDLRSVFNINTIPSIDISELNEWNSNINIWG